MKILKYSLLMLLCLALIAGCSKKQDEVDKLEKEMLGQVDTIADTMQADTMPVVAEVEVIEEEPEVDKMPARPAGNGFTVQVASCESEDYARYLVDLYTGRGYEPFVSEISIEGQTYNRVRIGMYENFADAKVLKAELLDKYSLETWIDYVTM